MFDRRAQKAAVGKQAASKSQVHHSGAAGCAQNMERNGPGDEFLKNSWTGAGVRGMTDGQL